MQKRPGRWTRPGSTGEPGAGADGLFPEDGRTKVNEGAVPGVLAIVTGCDGDPQMSRASGRQVPCSKPGRVAITAKSPRIAQFRPYRSTIKEKQ